jgi:integrase
MSKSNRPPKYGKLNKYAVVYVNGKPHYLGVYGSEESKIAYARIITELQASPVFSPPSGEEHVSVRELTAAFLDHAQANFDYKDYSHSRVAVIDFLDKLYGDDFPVEDFKPRCLKLIRTEMIQSRRFCRRVVNRYTHRVVSIFAWGVENDLVPETTWRALKAVKSLRKGDEGTVDNEERQPVPDDVVRRTLPFMPPTLRAMVQLQRILGMRPSEIAKMRVGDIDTTRGNGLWYYVPGSCKTARYVGKIVFPLGKPEQELIAPYLVSKKSEAAVFSPRTAQAERNAEKRANRKTKITPSQQARNRERAENPADRVGEFYDSHAYRIAVNFAIAKGNKVLPEGEKIPHWFPYQLRHSAATQMEAMLGDTEAQALLGHKSVNMTKRYSKAQLAQREALARNRQNPFETNSDDAEV